MSAAEKMKALDVFEAGELRIYRDALPQIVAVVEAAEAFALRVEESEQNERTFALDDSLAALNEALG